MRDKADAWQMEITSVTWEFEKITENLEPAQINFKPNPSSWSIAENLSHLIRLNSSYYPIFDQVISGTYKAPILGKIPFVVNALGALLYRSMSSSSKAKTFRIWEPLASQDDIVPTFRDHQMELSSYIQRLEPFFETGTVIHSPANRFLVYRLDQAIDILVAHEKRHLNQCKNILPLIPDK